jgi:hypothetical protein
MPWPRRAGEYTLRAALGSPDDRIRLWLDNVLVLDQWASLGASAPTGTLAVPEAGYFFVLDLHYRHANASAPAALSFEWSPTAPPARAATFEPVPSQYLFAAVPVAASPYAAFIAPAATSGVLSGFSGLSFATAGAPAAFDITARDTYGNDLDFSGVYALRTTFAGGADSSLAFAQPGPAASGRFLLGAVDTVVTRAGTYASTLFSFQQGGVAATYYTSSDLTGVSRSPTHPTVDLCPESGCPSRPRLSGLGSNPTFSARFFGSVQPTAPGSTTFRLTVKDAADRVRPPPPPLVLSGHAASLTPY